MKKKLLIGALAFALVAVVSTVVLATIIEDQEEPGTFYAVIEGPPGGGTCTCPMIFAPVLCDKGGETKAYSNACFAGCHGATNCRQIVWQ